MKKGKVVFDEKVIISAFGFGRRCDRYKYKFYGVLTFHRICPGRHTAFSTVWIAIASMLASFTITKAIDEHGSPIMPELKYSHATSW